MALPILLEGVTRFYGKHRGVEDISFAVEEGEIFGFLGPNGAGKTTTIRMLMGLIRPSGGSAHIFGRDCWADSAAVKTDVGFLPGDIRLYERMTGHEFLDFFAAFRSGKGRDRGRKLAARLGVDLDRSIRHLSKGNRQKLAIVQALMHDAPMLIMDEPSSGLDPLVQSELLEIFLEEQARGKTLFLSSHVLPEVERIAHRVAIIREGRLVTVEEVARLRAMRERQMEVLLREPVSPERFAVLDGVRVMATDPVNRQLILGVRGDIQPLLRLLGELPVEDIIYGPPDLEDVFLHFYGPAEAAEIREESMRS
jgi:ABC-2 type transport system ATP-binding protein